MDLVIYPISGCIRLLHNRCGTGRSPWCNVWCFPRFAISKVIRKFDTPYGRGNDLRLHEISPGLRVQPAGLVGESRIVVKLTALKSWDFV